VTRNEILYGLNQQDKFILAIVLVDGDQHEGPFYVTKPFTQEPDWAVTSINLDLNQLLAKARGRCVQQLPHLGQSPQQDDPFLPRRCGQ
jgi:hypothetical protein